MDRGSGMGEEGEKRCILTEVRIYSYPDTHQDIPLSGFAPPLEARITPVNYAKIVIGS
jgi:hypothetical protein